MMIEPSKKRKLKWRWFLLVPLLLLGMLFVQAFGPNPAIEIRKETTFITEPLLDNGLPNYPGYLLHRETQIGVTPENNAAVLISRALWPCELEKEEQPEVLEALGIPLPDSEQTLVSAYDTRPAINQWILNTVPDAYAESLDDDFSTQIVIAAMTSTWQPGQLPTIDSWAKQNKQPLDWLREGAARPKYYFPRRNYENQSLSSWLLPDIYAVRSAVRDLCVRAMWNLSHDRHEECWQDLLASYRLARHINQGVLLIHNFVAVAMEGTPRHCVHQLIHDKDVPKELLSQIKSDLVSLPPRKMMSQFFDEGERLWALDTSTRIAGGTMSLDQLFFSGEPPDLQLASRIRLDWNVVLRQLNQWFNRYEVVARLPYDERRDAIESLGTDVDNLVPKRQTGRFAHSIVSLRARSEWFGDTVALLLLPACRSAMDAEDRTLAYEGLLRGSLALAQYRAQHAEYPDTLDKLVPDFVKSVPLDYFTGSRLVYQRKPDGFLLYSVFEGTDDGGTDQHQEIVEGEYKADDVAFDNNRDTYDLVVRIPKPPFKMPRIVLMKEAEAFERARETDPYSDPILSLDEDPLIAPEAE